MKKAIEEIRGTDSADLKAQLADLRKEQFELRFHGSGDAATSGTNTVRARVIRRTIARILTILGERERQAATAGGSN
ncbi:MAG TPA: 50S ribosomal protein L29 [bacterium]|nr:50S ribosomal protein L29 [bacterium]